MVQELELDVRELEPPEPLTRVLAAAGRLEAGERIRMLQRFEPFPLYGLLEQRGFSYRVERPTVNRFEIVIWRADDPASGAAP
jgi:uncharacterized protein (DUF2249 family)